MQEELALLFRALPVPTATAPNSLVFAAHPVAGHPAHRIAKDERGAPVLLISMAGRSRTKPCAPTELENLRALHEVECQVVKQDGQREGGWFSVIQCTADDKALHALFLQVAGPLIALLGDHPSGGELVRVIDRLAELFSFAAYPPRKTVQGVWAELFLIAQSLAPGRMLACWHFAPEELHDFSAGPQRIEVKSACGETREHHFSLKQLHPPVGVHLLIASMFVERAGGGTSLADLRDAIRARVVGPPELLVSLDRVIVMALGLSWARAMDDRFDIEKARKSLRFYESGSVPSVGLPLPAGVSHVRFVSDIGALPYVGEAALSHLGGLFLDASPAR